MNAMSYSVAPNLKELAVGVVVDLLGSQGTE
jgi:hypothetical protein